MCLNNRQLNKLAQRLRPVNEKLNNIYSRAEITIDTDVNLLIDNSIICYFNFCNPDDLVFLAFDDLEFLSLHFNGATIMSVLIEFYNSVRKILIDFQEELNHDGK